MDELHSQINSFHQHGMGTTKNTVHRFRTRKVSSQLSTRNSRSLRTMKTSMGFILKTPCLIYSQTPQQDALLKDVQVLNI